MPPLRGGRSLHSDPCGKAVEPMRSPGVPHRPQGERNPRETPTEAATTRTRCGSKQVPSRNIAKATPCSTLKLLGRLWFSVDEDAQSEHPATLTGLPGRAHSCMVVVPAIGLLIELYCRVSAGALRFLFSALFFRCLWKTGSQTGPRARIRGRNWNGFVFHRLSYCIY